MSSTVSSSFVDTAADAISLAVARRPQQPSLDTTDTQNSLPFNEIDAFIERVTQRRYVKVHALFDTAWFDRVVQNPDQCIDAPWTSLLKNDTSTTVALTSFDGQQIVIKRYNPRHPLYAAKRLLRESRASHCLRASVLFSQAGINVAQCVGMIEKRVSHFKGTSYYLMLHTPGILLSDWFADSTTLRDQDTSVLHAISETFEKLTRHQLFHGDMKATNLVWQNGKLVLLDLDAARQCLEPQRLQQRLDADKARFLKNFADKPQLQADIKNALRW